jgi:hypothetical protein
VLPRAEVDAHVEQVSYEVLGEVLTVDLIDDGANVSVTSANRDDYIQRHTRFLLEVSLRPVEEGGAAREQ